MADRFKNLAKGGWNPEKKAGSGAGGVHDSKVNQVVCYACAAKTWRTESP